jgi:hypothetical protein
MPATICHLKALGELELHGNHLLTLPPSLCQLSPAYSLHGAVPGRLTRLTLHNNNLDAELSEAATLANLFEVLQRRYSAFGAHAHLSPSPELPDMDMVGTMGGGELNGARNAAGAETYYDTSSPQQHRSVMPHELAHGA